MFAKTASAVAGHVVVEESEGFAHVHAVRSHHEHTTDHHTSGKHDHAHSAVAPSHALEWGGYAGKVVTNSGVSSGSQGIVAAVAADDDTPVTTTSDLAQMTLVELLSRILGLGPLSPTVFEITRKPSVTWSDDPLTWQGGGHLRGVVALVLSVDAPAVDRGLWSNNIAAGRADGLRLITATKSGSPGSALAESAVAFAVAADPPRLLPFGSREKETLLFDATEMHALLYSDTTAVTSLNKIGGRRFAARKAGARLGLHLLDGDGNDDNDYAFTAGIDPIRYFNEDEPPPASEDVVADSAGFRRIYVYSHQPIAVSGSLGLPLDLGTAAQFSVGDVDDSPVVASYSDIDGTTRTFVSDDVSTKYDDMDLSTSVTTGGLQVLFDEIAVGSGTSTNVRRLVRATANGEPVDISNTRYVSGTEGAVMLVLEVPLHTSGSAETKIISSDTGTTRAVSRLEVFGMQYPEIVLHYALRTEHAQLQEGGGVLVLGPLLQIPQYPQLHVSMSEVVEGVTSTTTWRRTFVVVGVNTTDQRHIVDEGKALVTYHGDKAYVNRRGMAIVRASSAGEVARYHAGTATITGRLVLRVARVFSMFSLQSDTTMKPAPLLLSPTTADTDRGVARTDVKSMPFSFKGWAGPETAYALEDTGAWVLGTTNPEFNTAVDLNGRAWDSHLKFSYSAGEMEDSTPYIGSAADAIAYWQKSECIRFGFTFGMAGGGSEDIAVPMHHTIERSDGSTYTGVSNLGRCDADVVATSDYDRTSAEELSITDVQDVGSGLISTVTGMGFLIKSTFVHACRLDIRHNTAGNAWDTVNRFRHADEGSIPLWEIPFDVVFDMRINDSAGEEVEGAVVIQQLSRGEYDGKVLYSVTVPKGAHFVFVVHRVAWRRYRMKAGTTDADGAYTSLPTAADFDPSHGDVVVGNSVAEGTAYARISPSTKYVNSHHKKIEYSSGGIWFQILATGVRAWLRHAMRKALGTPTPPEASDFDAVDNIAEFIEWPTTAAVMGHDAGAWLEIRGRGGGTESEVLDVLSDVGMFELDNYRRYSFNPLEITTGGDIFDWLPKGEARYQGFRFLAKGASYTAFKAIADVRPVYKPENDWGDSDFAS
jgi:hypothetical protein